MGNRMSSLPVAQHCGRGPELGSISSGRPAAMSSAFHARAANMPEAADLWARLTDAERREVESWKRPDDLIIRTEEGNAVLRYRNAYVEHEVGFTADFGYTDDPAQAVTVGHVDMHWEPIQFTKNCRLVVVGDIKRSEWTTPDGPESLQLHAYGLALAAKYDATAYLPGIWGATEGVWWWGEVVNLASARALQLAQTVVASARNVGGDFVVGAHCRRCYGRQHCPAWLMPPEMASSALAPLTAGTIASPEQWAELVLATQRAADTVEHAKKLITQALQDGVKIEDPVTGKVYKLKQMPGRSSVAVQALRDALGEEGAKRFIRVGEPYYQPYWGKP